MLDWFFRSGGRRRVIRKAKAIQGGNAELLLQNPLCVICIENPLIKARDHSAHAIQRARSACSGLGEKRAGPSQQDFARAQ